MQYEHSYGSNPKMLQYLIPYFLLTQIEFFSALVHVIMCHNVFIDGFYQDEFDKVDNYNSNSNLMYHDVCIQDLHLEMVDRDVHEVNFILTFQLLLQLLYTYISFTLSNIFHHLSCRNLICYIFQHIKQFKKSYRTNNEELGFIKLQLIVFECQSYGEVCEYARGNCRFRRKGVRKVGILKQKYKNNKQNTQMQMSSEHKRKRKGISVSLTPDKKWEQGPRGLSPSVPPVRIQQSQVRIQQSQVRILQPAVFQPQPIRVFESVRPVDSRVTFNYTMNASKEQQIRQSQMLNQQLLHLHRQIQNKKNTIQALQQQNIYVSSRPFQEKIVLIPPNIAPITQIPIVNNNRSSWNPCLCIQPQTPANYEQHIQIGPKNPQNMNEFKQATKNYIQNETLNKPDCKAYLSGTLKQIKPSQILNDIKNETQKQDRKDENFCYSDRQGRGLQINKIVEIKTVQSCQGQESSRIRYEKGSPEKIANVDVVSSIGQVTKGIKKQQKQKQNESQSQMKKQAKKNRQKLEKLRWAEQKLLEIIKVCNNGL